MSKAIMDRSDMFREIEARMKHYPPTNALEIQTHERIRQTIMATAKQLVDNLSINVTNSREFSQVLTDLENAMMHANAAYARHKND